MSKTIRRVLLAGCLAFVVYPLSYAPVQRLLIGPDMDFSRYEHITFVPRSLERWEIAYGPVIFLMHRTSLREPLLTWSGIWRVEHQHRFHDIR